MKALCIGNVVYDYIMPMETFPKENIKYRIENTINCGGGPANNAAHLLSLWGVNTYFAGVIGNDENGKKIKEEFKNANINTKFLEINKENETAMSFILINSKSGSRTIFTKRSSKMKLTKEISIKPNLILIDGQELEASKKALENNPNAISIIDAGRINAEVIELAKMVDYVVCSKYFAEEFTKIKINLKDKETLKKIFNKLENNFKNVIITVEEKGTLCKVNNVVKLIPSIDVKELDSTGAGDVFHGAFAYCLLKKFDLEKSIKIANIAGAISVTRLGGRYSIPSLKEVMSTYKKCLK